MWQTLVLARQQSTAKRVLLSRCCHLQKDKNLMVRWKSAPAWSPFPQVSVTLGSTTTAPTSSVESSLYDNNPTESLTLNPSWVTAAATSGRSSTTVAGNINEFPNNKEALLVLAETLLHSQRWVSQSSDNNHHAWVKTEQEVIVETATVTTTTGTIAAKEQPRPPVKPQASSSLSWVVTEEDKQQQQQDTMSSPPSDDATTSLREQYVAQSVEPECFPSSVEQQQEEMEEKPQTMDDEIYHVRAARTIESFVEAVHNRKLLMGNQIFWYAKRHGMAHKLPPKDLIRLYSLCLSKRAPLFALPILEQYVKNQNLNPAQNESDKQHYVKLYSRMADVLRYLEPEKHKPWDMEKLVRAVLEKIKGFDYDGKALCLPILLSSLLNQRLVSLGKMSRIIYEHMLEMKLELSTSYMEHLLSMSKYQRQQDLPYAEILLSTVLRGHRPHPQTVATVVENLFPYTNMEDTRMILQALVELQSQKNDDDWRSYTLDMAVLETIATAVARSGDKDSIQLIWEYMDLSKLEPSIGIYESTAVTFSHNPDTYQNAFAVLEEMQVRGEPLSRALIRNMSTFLRLHHKNVRTALDLVLADIDEWLATDDRDDNKRPFPLGALNVVLSATAERGDLDQSVSIMNIVEESKLPVNVETFCYAFEVLGKHLSFRSKHIRDPRQLQAYVVGRAMEYLTMMEKRDIALSQHLIREYVEVLCNAGEFQTATQVVLDALECGTVSNKTIYRIAIVNAHEGSFETARHLAGRGTEKMPFLLDRIDRIERGGEVRDK
eukprot:scaffold4510_cov183-Amphora_coffeaeformis.AAC.32